jgi:hypothetical protein
MEPEEAENGSVWDLFLVWFFFCVVFFFGFWVLFLVGWEGWVFRDSSSSMVGWRNIAGNK